MDNDYRFNVRFHINKDDEKRAADYLRKLDTGKHKSRNAFVISAINHYIDCLETGEQRLIDDIRKVIREEVGHLPKTDIQPHTFKTELTNDDVRESEQLALEVDDYFS